MSTSAPDQHESCVDLLDISYRYPNGLEAVKGITLSLPKGSSTAIIGPSGCGKSTLLRLITGLADPSSGTVERHFQDGRHPVSLVFQEETLLPWLTVRENASLYFRLHRRALSRTEVNTRLDELLSMVGLEQFGSLHPRQMSGGMKRRLAFVAGVAPNPQLLLMDEPFSSVDEPSRIGIHQQVREIIRHSQMTTMLVTHDLAEAISLADRVVILSRRPAHVVSIHEVNLPRMDDLFGLRSSPEYLELYGLLWRDLSAEIRAAEMENKGQKPEKHDPGALPPVNLDARNE